MNIYPAVDVYYIHIAYYYQVLRRVQDDGVEQLVVVPLYPHYSVSTSGSSLKVRTIVVQCCI